MFDQNINIEDVRKAPVIAERMDHLKNALLKVLSSELQSGYILEFGVAGGRSLRVLADTAPGRVFGFDSFKGLPEAWEKGGYAAPKGKFAQSTIPEFSANVELEIGLFTETIPAWQANYQGPVAFIHIDSDLYSSAKYVLESLDSRIKKGTVIVFDELCDWQDSPIYPKWAQGEWKALKEWLAEKNRKILPLSRTANFEAAFEVVE